MSLHKPIYKSTPTPTSSCFISWSAAEQDTPTVKTSVLCTTAAMTFPSITEPVYVAEVITPHFWPWFGRWTIVLW